MHGPFIASYIDKGNSACSPSGEQVHVMTVPGRRSRDLWATGPPSVRNDWKENAMLLRLRRGRLIYDCVRFGSDERKPGNQCLSFGSFPLMRLRHPLLFSTFSLTTLDFIIIYDLLCLFRRPSSFLVRAPLSPARMTQIRPNAFISAVFFCCVPLWYK